MRLAVFTVSPNHRVPQARVLLDSVARFLPDALRFLVLSDELHPAVPYPPGCQVIPARMLGIAGFEAFAFRYTPAEFAAAVKAFAFQYLFATGSCSHCLFLSADTELFGPVPAITEALAADAPFVFTPHLLAPSCAADEDVTFLRDGAFNLGVLGVSLTPEARDVLAWWARWLQRNCVDDRPIGLYVDQRFMDLVPGFVSGVHILRDPGLNVAHWNLERRRFVPDAPQGPQVDGRPLGLFNFSGFDPANPDRLSADTPRWKGDSLPGSWRTFLASYAARLLRAGHGAVPPGEYAFGRFASGTPIPAIARRMFRDDYPAWAGNPFETFERWCHLPARDAALGLGSAVPSLIMQWLQARRQDLAQLSMREPGGAERLTRWWLHHGTTIDVDHRFLQPQALAAGLRPLSPTAVRPAPEPGRADATVIAPLTVPDPAGMTGRALLGGLQSSAGRVERLDVLAPGVGPVSGRVLVLCVAPERLRPMLHVLTTRLPSRAYRVFVPAGERVEASPALLGALAGVDEVWAPTRFMQSVLEPLTTLPVLHVPAAWRWPEPLSEAPVPSGRPYILAEPDGFPGPGALLAALRAYITVFGATPAALRPRLVIPGGEDDPWNGDLLAVVQEAGAVLLPATGPERVALASAAACVMALHRGDALGLPVARALASGTPVIATDYGGCTDLLTPRTGFPVNASQGPDAAMTADPCHAAWSLREVFERPDDARRRADAGRRTLAALCSPAAAGDRMAARLRLLGLIPPGTRANEAA